MIVDTQTDFTGHGAFYCIIILVRLLATGIISAVVSNAEAATIALITIYAVNAVVVIWWHPFANSFLQLAEAGSVVINLTCLVLTWLGAQDNNHTTRNDILFGTYLLLQCISIFVLTMPTYGDLLITLGGTMRKKFSRQKGPHEHTDNSDDAAAAITHIGAHAPSNTTGGGSGSNAKWFARKPKRPHAGIRKRDWFRFLRVMIRHNLWAMTDNLRHGMQSRSAKSTDDSDIAAAIQQQEERQERLEPDDTQVTHDIDELPPASSQPRLAPKTEVYRSDSVSISSGSLASVRDGSMTMHRASQRGSFVVHRDSSGQHVVARPGLLGAMANSRPVECGDPLRRQSTYRMPAQSQYSRDSSSRDGTSGRYSMSSTSAGDSRTSFRGMSDNSEAVQPRRNVLGAVISSRPVEQGPPLRRLSSTGVITAAGANTRQRSAYRLGDGDTNAVVARQTRPDQPFERQLERSQAAAPGYAQWASILDVTSEGEGDENRQHVTDSSAQVFQTASSRASTVSRFNSYAMRSPRRGQATSQADDASASASADMSPGSIDLTHMRHRSRRGRPSSSSVS